MSEQRSLVDAIMKPLHPIVKVIERTAIVWAPKEQAAAQARVIAIELIENGLVLDGIVEHGMPLQDRFLKVRVEA